MALDLHIPNPCPMRWEELQPTGDGVRLCTRCARRVTDFRGMSDDQIARVHAEADRPICGVYDEAQLRPRAVAPPSARSRLVTLALGATLLSGTAAAQAPGPSQSVATEPANPPPHAPDAEHAPADAPAPEVEDSFVVRGTVRNAQGQPLPDAFVEVAGTQNRAMTDSLGRFILRIGDASARRGAVRLRFFSIGYEGRTVSVLGSPAPGLDVVLPSAVVGLVGPSAPRRPWLVRAFRSIFF